MKELYIQRTVRDGVEKQEERDVNEINEKAMATLEGLFECLENSEPDAMVFLDKAARPLSWSFKKILAEKMDKSIKAPLVKYLNIGTEKFVSLRKHDHDRKLTISAVYNMPFYLENPSLVYNPEDNAYQEEINDLKRHYEKFNRIMVVDEFAASGQSLARTGFIIAHMLGKKMEDCIFRVRGGYTQESSGSGYSVNTDYLLKEDENNRGHFILKQTADVPELEEKYENDDYLPELKYDSIAKWKNIQNEYFKKETENNGKLGIVLFAGKFLDLSFKGDVSGVAESDGILSKRENDETKRSRMRDMRSDMDEISNAFLEKNNIRKKQ